MSFSLVLYYLLFTGCFNMLCFELVTPKKGSKKIGDYLLSQGAMSLTLEPENNGQMKLVTHWDDEARKVLDRLSLSYAGSVVYDLLEEDWLNKWLVDFDGITIDNKIQIMPVSSERESLCERETNPLQIYLDMRDAFGSGTHPTTQLCLLAIAKILESNIYDNGKLRMIDAGTGTGVLAIAALLYGAGHVTGFDIEEASIEKAKYNAELNGVEDKVYFYQGNISKETSSKKADLVTANLLTVILEENFDILDSLVAEDGLLLLSGVSNDSNREFSKYLTGKKWALLWSQERDGWFAYLLSRSVQSDSAQKISELFNKQL